VHRSSSRRLAIAVSTAALALGVLPAGAAPTAPDTTVTVTGSTIRVIGGAIEGGVGRAIGTDAADDAVGSGLGVDLAQYTLGFPRKNVVEFGLVLGDVNPATGHAPQGVKFQIDATVGANAVSLTATPMAGSGLTFAAQTCDASSGVNQCTTTPVEGRYEDGTLIWEVTTSGVGTKLGGGTASVNPSATVLGSGLTLNGGLIDTMSASSGTAPTATILVDGTPATAGNLLDSGFDVSATGVASGTHAVGVRLCDGTTAPTACTVVDLGTVTIP
jgi:hypothetical protein